MKSPNEVKKIMTEAAQETIQASTTQAANVQKAFEGTTVQTRAAMEKGLDQASKSAADLMKAARTRPSSAAATSKPSPRPRSST
jgi:hypothetical protein